ncbi:MAG: hypothetical protein AAGA81_05840 [Acidobacteriota bacterium]
MDRLYDSGRVEAQRLPLAELRWVVFSDHHRGKLDAADDFATCARAYRTALAHYLAEGFGLCLLGDVEELWECDPNDSLEAHADCVDLESRFARRGRLHRVWGNHDDEWASAGSFDRAVRRVLEDSPEIEVREAVVFELLDPDRIGSLVLAHGHQGTAFSDRLSFVSRFLVRHVWRPWQRRTGQRITSLSGDYGLRHQHEIAQSRWAASRNRVVLISGHTHHPVFAGEAKETYLMRRRSELEAELQSLEDPFLRSDLERRLTELRADLRYREARSEGHLLRAGESNEAYFNAGCCSYKSGSITGIELADAEIRLVRWHQQELEPQREVLRSRGLRELFSRLD